MTIGIIICVLALALAGFSRMATYGDRYGAPILGYVLSIAAIGLAILAGLFTSPNGLVERLIAVVMLAGTAWFAAGAFCFARTDRVRKKAPVPEKWLAVAALGLAIVALIGIVPTIIAPVVGAALPIVALSAAQRRDADADAKVRPYIPGMAALMGVGTENLFNATGARWVETETGHGIFMRMTPAAVARLSSGTFEKFAEDSLPDFVVADVTPERVVLRPATDADLAERAARRAHGGLITGQYDDDDDTGLSARVVDAW